MIEEEKGENGEKEATTMAAVIDWNNFIVVNTINFNEDQSTLQRLPKPLTLTQLRSESFLPPKPSINSNLPPLPVKTQPQPQPQPNTPPPGSMPVPIPSQIQKEDGKIEILEDYKPGSYPNYNREISTNSGPVNTQICPRCGQSIPIHQMEEHMRIELMDTRFIDRKKTNDQFKSNITTDEDMSVNLSNFFQKRTQQEEKLINSALEDKKRKREEISWDNRPVPSNLQDQSESLSNQIKSIYSKDQNPISNNSINTGNSILNKSIPNNSNITSLTNKIINNNNNSSKSFDDDPPTYPGFSNKPFTTAPPFLSNIISAANLDPNNFIPAPETSKPKKIKSESTLIPEDEFIKNSSSPSITIQIQVPKSDKKGKGKLEGQTLDIELNLTDKITNLKEKIFQLTEIPVNKQKLKFGNTYMNDNNTTIAYHNLRNSDLLILSLKERGGRR